MAVIIWSFIYSVASLLSGFILGFIASIPMTGPLGVYITGKGISGHLKEGLVTALGCAIVETVYCFIAVMGMASIIPEQPYRDYILFAGAFVIIYLGFSGLKKRETPCDIRIGKSILRNFGNFGIGVLVTSLNPYVMLNWVAVAAVATSYGFKFTACNACFFAFGVGAGTIFWFYVYLMALNKARSVFRMKYLNFAIQSLSIILIGIGIYLICISTGTVVGALTE